ncbi:MAG: hypothetical protein A2Z34_12130 [Planctomycetes bacterium RBG_16_59_8]|nr:MAG: hypothetical protein A2Z34_12130 [Planctomycetes bacterium RBG_16_59_8]
MTDQKTVRQHIRRTIRLMDYISERYLASEKPGRRASSGVYYEIYQTLATAWHYWGLMCRHGSGHRKTGGGRQACRICGLLKDAPETEYLLPARGAKVIGRYRPSPQLGAKAFPNRRKASVVDDDISFHGTKLRVRVHHAYPSCFFNRHDINIAADRSVEIREREVRILVDNHLVHVRLSGSDRRRGKTYGGFVGELPRRLLKKFPILVSYESGGRFRDIEVFRPRKR